MFYAQSLKRATFVFTPSARSLPVPSAKNTMFFVIGIHQDHEVDWYTHGS